MDSNKLYFKGESCDVEYIKADFIRKLLIEAQDDLLRMMGNAQTQKQAEEIIENKYNTAFYVGCIKSNEYACKHLTNILTKIE